VVVTVLVLWNVTQLQPLGPEDEGTKSFETSVTNRWSAWRYIP